MASEEAAPAVDLTWTEVGQSAQLAPRSGHSLAVVPSPTGPKVYALGGAGSLGAALSSSSLLQALDPSLASWAPVPLPPQPVELPQLLSRTGHASAVVGTSIITFGGVVAGKVTNDVLCLDTASGSWEVGPTLTGAAPAPRCYHTATAVGNAIFVFGGRSAEEGQEGVAFNDVWVLDWTKKSWSQTTPLGTPPPPLHSHSATLVLPEQQRILVSGGVQGSPSPATPEAAAAAASAEIWFLEVDTPFVRSPGGAPASSPAPAQRGVAWSRGVVGAPPRPVVICGPSGVGKGTLIAKLMAEFPHGCGFSVSHTTRQPRPGEVDGVHYHFSTRPAMEADIQAGKFLEKADVHGNYYGTSVAAVQKVTDSGKMCILDIDVQGAQQVKKSPISALFIFVAPPSFEELERRLRGRGTETEEQVQKRLRNARKELESGEDAELFNHRIVNDNLDAAYAKLKELLGLASSAEAESSGAPVLGKRFRHASASVVGGRVLLHGGLGSDSKPAKQLLVLDTSRLSGGAPGASCRLACARVTPPAPSLWASFLSIIGFTPDPAPSEAEGDGDPAPKRSRHQAVSVGPSEVLIAGGLLEDGASATGATVTLTLDASS